MKLFSSKSEPKTPPSLVAFAPGDFFFMRRFDLPAGMGSGEVADFVELQLEELSPFAIDQLYYGRVMAEGAVFIYAAYRRRFSPEQTEDWADRMFVLPDFAGVLHLKFDEPTTVLFRTAGALMAFRFEAGRKLPLAGAGRALPADADEAKVQKVRAKLLEIVEGEGSRVITLRPGRPPEQRPQGLRFVFASDDGNGPVEVTVSSADCWRMDIREDEFVARQRQRLRVDLVFWRVVVGAAAAVAILIAGELLLLGAKGYVGLVKSRVERQAEETAALIEKDTIANRVAEFDRSDMQPITMITAVAGRKPSGVVFTRATISSGNRLEFDATTANVAEVNAFEAALKTMPEVETVSVEDIRTSAEGTQFSINVLFKDGAFPARARTASLGSKKGEAGS